MDCGDDGLARRWQYWGRRCGMSDLGPVVFCLFPDFFFAFICHVFASQTSRQ